MVLTFLRCCKRHFQLRESIAWPQSSLEVSAAAGACVRLPGAPKTVSLANSLPPRPTLNPLPSPCVCHIALPMSPGRPNAHVGRTPLPTPDPIRARYPEKSVTFPRHPFPAMPHPTPHTSHLFITPAPFLPTNPPQARNNPEISPTLLKHTHMRATLAHARDRPRGTETLPPAGLCPRHS